MKNDVVTINEFSKFLTFALKDLPPHQKLQITMDLNILGNYQFSKNPIERLLSKIQSFFIRKKIRKELNLCQV